MMMLTRQQDSPMLLRDTGGHLPKGVMNAHDDIDGSIAQGFSRWLFTSAKVRPAEGLER